MPALSPEGLAVQARLTEIIDAATADGRRELNAAEAVAVQNLIEGLDADDLLIILATRGLG
jgi:hypothetical protein